MSRICPERAVWSERGRPPAGWFTKRGGRGVASRRARPGAPRDAAGSGPDRRDVRRCGRGVAALHRARPRAQAVDRRRLPGAGPVAAAAGVRRPADRVDHDADDRALARRGRPRRRARARSRSCCCTASSSGRASSTACRSIRPPTSRSRRQRRSGDIEVFSPEEVHGARPRGGVGAGRSDLPHGGVHRACAAASCWRCAGATSTSPARSIRVRASYAEGELTTPKSGKVRSVPMAPDVAEALAALGAAPQRGPATTTWCSPARPARSSTGARCAAATSRRSSAPACARLRFHDLRHTFGTRDDRQGRHPPRAGVDGPRRRPDDDEVPPLRAARGGRRARRRGVRRSTRPTLRRCTRDRRRMSPTPRDHVPRARPHQRVLRRRRLGRHRGDPQRLGRRRGADRAPLGGSAARRGRPGARLPHSDGFISPLDLVEIGLLSREDAQELHAIETSRQRV